LGVNINDFNQEYNLYGDSFHVGYREEKDMSNRLKWFLAALIALGVVFIAQATSLSSLYLPLVYNKYLIATPTNTPKPGECLSGKTNGVCITDIDYKPITSPLDEFVSIKNKGNSSVNMELWRVSSDSGNKFDLIDEFTLSVSATVKIWTKHGDDNSTNIYMDLENEFWNDSKDCAWLKDDSDPRKTIDGVCYGTNGQIYSPAP
jgi:hypothetical protein